jgi:putative phosphoesterase
MKIAVMSDIHGNSWALEKVLQDMDRRQPDIIFNLGDSLYGPLDPYSTYEMLRSREIVHVSGNEDRLIMDFLNGKTENELLGHMSDHFSKSVFEWLESLPQSVIFRDRYFLCHGTPASDSEYLLEEVNKTGIEIRSADKLYQILYDIQQEIVFCGHSHRPGIVKAASHLIINPGSVGLQSFDDDFPCKHNIENHSPHARYCIVEINDSDIKTEQIMISYDFEKAARCAEKNKRSDWARWLRTGDTKIRNS